MHFGGGGLRGRSNPPLVEVVSAVTDSFVNFIKNVLFLSLTDRLIIWCESRIKSDPRSAGERLWTRIRTVIIRDLQVLSLRVSSDLKD